MEPINRFWWHFIDTYRNFLCLVFECHFTKQIYANMLSSRFSSRSRTEPLKSGLIECFFFIIITLCVPFFSPPTFNRLLLVVSSKMGFYDSFQILANGTVPITQYVSLQWIVLRSHLFISLAFNEYTHFFVFSPSLSFRCKALNCVGFNIFCTHNRAVRSLLLSVECLLHWILNIWN